MSKIFVPYDTVRDNGLALAQQIYRDGFVPDVIYVSLRGGACLGNVISEYFKLISAKQNLKPVLYAAVVARSYSGPASRSVKITVDGWTYNPKYLRHGDRVLLVDDIYDTGHTVDYLSSVIAENGIDPQHLKVAVHDYKHCLYRKDERLITPDYYCREIVVNSDKEESTWIHYLSHELVGLTETEIKQHYPVAIQKILMDQMNI